MKTFGEKLRKSRIKKGYRQSDLASLVGVARSSIANYESNFVYPTLEVAVKISRILGFSLDDIVLLDTTKSVIDSRRKAERNYA